MKVQRSSGGARPLRGATGAGSVQKAKSVGSTQALGSVGTAGSVGATGDVATIMGLTPTELTPKVRAALDRLMAEVAQVRGELDQARKRIDYLEKLADQDVLTPVLNRRAFVRELGRSLAFSERYDAPGAVIYMDVNGMKGINDTLGHEAGDAAILHVAQTLMDNLRASDFVGRLGGDEFGIILLQTTAEVAAQKAAFLAHTIEHKPMDYNGSLITVQVAYGVHSFSGQDADAALKAADQAMYEQKQSRKKQGE